MPSTRVPALDAHLELAGVREDIHAERAVAITTLAVHEALALCRPKVLGDTSSSGSLAALAICASTSTSVTASPSPKKLPPRPLRQRRRTLPLVLAVQSFLLHLGLVVMWVSAKLALQLLQGL